MFSSETISSRDMSRISSSGFNLSNPANLNSFKQVSSAHDGEFIVSDFFPNQNQQQQLNQPSCGLARYKSAPSSFLAALLDSNNTDNSSSGDESEAFFSALMSGPSRDLNQTNSNINDGNHHEMQYDMVKQEESEARPGQNGSVNGQMGYEGAVNGGGGCIVGSYSVGMESQVHNNMRMSSGNNGNNSSSSLVRQSSSPAGFFNGFGVMEKAISSANNGMSNHINFSSAPSSSTLITRFMPSIPENGNQDIARHNPQNGNNATVFPHESWNDSPFTNSLKRNRDGEMRMFSNFNGLVNRDIGESRKGSSGLFHHLSLPETSTTEMAEVEKLLQFRPETVPCQVRAKRGFATHPRSIAERVRRTRISEKMKKLQDLFPNMDKQTSTADMLDLAVEYIKDLQKQVETLTTDMKGKCICSSKPQQQIT